MAKISFEEWKNSMSFMIDDEFDRHFLLSIEPLSKFINQNCHQFSNTNQLAHFLTTNTEFSAVEKLKAFISLIGLSEERLKRIVSLIRFRFNAEEFKSEWDINKISMTAQQNQEFRDLLVEFFIKGRNSKVGTKIPLYYMRNFKLDDPAFLSSLQDLNYVERILNDNEILGKYSNEVGAHVESIVQNRLEKYKQTINSSLQFETQKEFPLLNKNIDFLLPNLQAAIILIECSYNITTGSGQSKRADQLVEFYSKLMSHNANHRSNRIIILNYCDGFGWVGRQNDLHRIYDASDFVLNQQTITVLDEVLNEYYPNPSLP